MADVSVSEELPAPVEVAWSYMEDFGDMSRWSPDSEVTESTGEGAGAIRKVNSPDGRYVERCESYSPEKHSFQYSLLESPHPYESYLGTVTFTAIDDETCTITWEADFEMPSVKKEHVAKAIADTYRDYFITHLRTSLENR